MDTNINPGGHTGMGTAGGVILVVLNITGLQLLETIVLATLGAAVSFATTLALRALTRWLQQRQKPR